MEKDSSIIVSVLSHEQGFDNGKETTFYILNVICGSHEFTIKRRYKKFEELHEKLSKIYSNVPEMPGKSLLKVTKGPEIEKRRSGLEKLLKVGFG